MRTVRDSDGRRLLLLKQSGDSSLVRDPETGEETYVDNGSLTEPQGEPPLSTAARGLPEAVRLAVTACPDDQALGLLVTLADAGPVALVDLLGSVDVCESDLHGRLAELRAAGLVAEARVGGERGYDATALGEDAVTGLRGN